MLPEIHRGKVFSGLMSVADWLPTYAALAGISPQALGDIATGPRPLDGMATFHQSSPFLLQSHWLLKIPDLVGQVLILAAFF